MEKELGKVIAIALRHWSDFLNLSDSYQVASSTGTVGSFGTDSTKVIETGGNQVRWGTQQRLDSNTSEGGRTNQEICHSFARLEARSMYLWFTVTAADQHAVACSESVRSYKRRGR